jgi:hypothetical protein
MLRVGTKVSALGRDWDSPRKPACILGHLGAVLPGHSIRIQAYLGGLRDFKPNGRRIMPGIGRQFTKEKVMKRIYKYNIAPSEHFTIPLPVGAKVLSVGVQNDDKDIVVWAMVDVDPGLRTEDRAFGVFGTGHNLPKEVIGFIGTVHFKNGLVFHIFEVV